ncbi:expansin family protein [Pseudohyphozyma bogoriensis]|nr:expansin family protein [Pseudohyphozyma bogoriensis]
MLLQLSTLVTLTALACQANAHADAHAARAEVHAAPARMMRARGFGRMESFEKREGDALLLALPSSNSTSSSSSNSTSLATSGNSTATAVTATTLVNSPYFSTVALYYTNQGGQSACLTYNVDSELIFSVPTTWWLDTTGTGNADLCGKSVVVNAVDSDKSVTCKLLDNAGKEEYAGLSVAAFQALGFSLDVGMYNVTYQILNVKDSLIPSGGSGTVTLASDNSTVVAYGNSTTTTGSNSTVVAYGNSTVVAGAKNSTSTSLTSSSGSASKTAVKTDYGAFASSTATLAPSTTEAPTTTTAKPTTTTTTSTYDYESAASVSSSKSAAEAASEEAAAAYSSSSSAAAAKAYAKWASSSSAANEKYWASVSSSSAAAAAAWESQSAASAAAASSSKAAAAAASKKAEAEAEASSSSAAAAKASSSSSSSSGNGKTYSGGIATYFYQKGNAGNCGTVHSDSAYGAALPTATYDNGAYCGDNIKVCRVSTGDCITVEVWDSCPTCENDSCVDLSVAAYTALGTEEEGVFDITWSFV